MRTLGMHLVTVTAIFAAPVLAQAPEPVLQCATESDVGLLTVTVLDRAATPIEGAWVWIVDTQCAALTDVAGKVRLEIPSGDHWAIIYQMGFFQVGRRASVSFGEATELAVTLPESRIGLSAICVGLCCIGQLTIRLVDADTGEPIYGAAEAEVLSEDGPERLEAHGDGRAVWPDTRHGRFTLRVLAPGYDVWVRELEIASCHRVDGLVAELQRIIGAGWQ